MKQIIQNIQTGILLFLSLIAVQSLYAQVPAISYTLNTTETVTKNYTARDEVKMLPGFRFSAVGGNTFKANIDAGLLFPPTENTYALPNGQITNDPTQGSVVGSIPGQFSVSEAGSATYTIPIEVPAGINGMQPAIAIGYNSNAGYGTLGTGWNLTGISAITRGGKSIYFDSSTESIKFNNTDALYLDGQRLILLSGTHFSPDAIYATEVEDYSRVKIHLNTDGSIYFVLTTIEGKIIEFGKTVDSKLTNYFTGDHSVLSWKINSAIDTYNNSINYSYTHTPGDTIPEHSEWQWDGQDDIEIIIPEEIIPASNTGQYLKQIDYAGQTISFVYIEDKVNPRKTVIKDFSITQSEILKTITTKSGSSTLKSYEFEYLQDNRLHSIGMSVNNIKVNSTIVNWGQESSLQAIELGSATDPWLNSVNPGSASMQFADINGDGYADRLEMWSGNSNENGHIIAYLYDNTHKTFVGSVTTSIEFDYHDYERYQPQMITSDINNDGKAELIFINYNLMSVYYFNNTTNSFSSYSSFTTNMIFDTYDQNNKIRFMSADVNNDNFNDVILAYGYNNTEFGSGVFYGSQYGLLNSSDYFKSGVNAFRYLEAGDFNADNKIDIIGSRYSSSADPVDMEYSYIRFKTNYYYFENSENEYRNSGDLNGDGLTDILIMDKVELKWYVYKNNGNFNLTKIPLIVTWDGVPSNLPYFTQGENSDNKTYFIDFDGDGLLDIVSAFHHIDHWIEGTGFFNPATPVIENSLRFFKNKGNFTFDWTGSYEGLPGKISNLNTVTDVNGDGIADFVVAVNNDNSTTTPYNYKYFSISIPQSNRRNIVSGITNGMGQTTSFTYKNFSEYEAYSNEEATSKIRPLRSPLLLVNSITLPDGSVITYNFEKPKYHTEGKSFLGFSTVTSTNTQLNTKSTSNYIFNDWYYFQELQEQSISTVNGTDNITNTTQTNDVKSIDSIRKRFIPYVKIQNSEDFLNGISQSVNTDFNNYPNSLTKTVTVGNMTSTTVTTFTGPSGKTPFLPSNITVTNNLNGEIQTRLSSFSYTYDTNNNQPYKIIGKTEIVDPEDENQTTTVFSNYDSWGHPQNVSVTANNKTRTSSLNYTSSRSSTGRFLQSETNALQETTNYNWNEITGLLDSKIDAKNLTTNYLYDQFGQLTETTYPNGIREAKTLQWAGSSGITGSKYYSYSQMSGQAPLIIWYDELGREIQRDTYGLNNNKISVNTDYYESGTFKGRIQRISEPYFEGDDKTWATIYNTYDQFGRVKSITSSVGTTSYNYDVRSISFSSPEGTSKKTINSSGLTDNVIVNEKKVSYTYWPSGHTKTATPEGGQEMKMFYNLQGNRIRIIDPDAGTIRNEYNGFGEITKQVQLIHTGQDSTITINNYDTQTRLITSINRNGDITTYTYDTGHGYKSRIKSIEIAGQHKQTFSYDAFDRITNIKEEIIENGTSYKEFNRSNEYDELGRIKKEKYSSGYFTINNYDQYSNLTEVYDSAGRLIWKVNDINAMGQVQSVSKGNKVLNYEYDPLNHQTTSILASGIVDYSYGYYPDNNLQWRVDNLSVQREDFEYDDQKRLTNWNITSGGQLTYNSINFDDHGNIQSKSDLGNCTLFYGLKGKPHALDSINGVPGSFPAANLDVTYTDFKKIKNLTEGNKSYELTYGVDDQRRKSVYRENGQTKLTRYYVGDYEEEINDLTGNIRKIHYLSGAIYIDNSNYSDSLYYVYTDNQGSVLALTDDDGTVKSRFAYDPWGKRRNPTNWTEADNLTGLISNRGYTGHEHLDAFGIINMNGRVYDPLTAQFFSPDPFLQAPDNWLNYNRYGYVFGNPFSYTDPSGYVSDLSRFIRNNWKPIATTAAGIAVGVGVGLLTGGGGIGIVIQSAVVSGAAGRATSGVLGSALNGGSFGDCVLAGTKGIIYGGMSGLVGGTLGSIAPLGTEWIGSTIWGSAGGTATQAFDIWISGGDDYSKLWQGAIIGGAFGFFASENFNNFVRDKGFYSNDKVLENFEAGKYNTTGFSSWQDAALDYFGFEGSYSYGKYENDAWFSSKTGIGYSDGAFSSYDNLKQSYTKELFEKIAYLSKSRALPLNPTGIPTIDIWQQEFEGHLHIYKNNGLYPDATPDPILPINQVIKEMRTLNLTWGGQIFNIPSFEREWWHFIFKIQRRW